MMRVDSGGGPSPEDELHQLFRHYRKSAHQDDGRRVLGDGRGLGGPPLVQRRLDRQGRRGRQGQRARARLRGHGGRARGQDHRARGGRQPDSRQEGGVACARMTAF